jgi:hypothetical protein
VAIMVFGEGGADTLFHIVFYVSTYEINVKKNKLQYPTYIIKTNTLFNKVINPLELFNLPTCFPTKARQKTISKRLKYKREFIIPTFLNLCMKWS